ncbi:hypothetical protein BTR14_01695 [Rhizobium rhizosphaerae]|uniref:Uncharacterized protein n=1 Tax=Xaviernesmea rhizosphaerae TaxID=1672749 RepID=A0ABX3PJ62_9HYPH|nr:hypothetical protein [Xaviernesmea rhizosphaerae]OQP88195.1 hypothetical protein BTR14_01695 [Xaviernesmea rhizosphaerae]
MDEVLTVIKAHIPEVVPALEANNGPALMAGIDAAVREVCPSGDAQELQDLLTKDAAKLETLTTRLTQLIAEQTAPSVDSASVDPTPVAPTPADPAPVTPGEQVTPGAQAASVEQLRLQIELERLQQNYQLQRAGASRYPFVNPALSIMVTASFIVLVFVMALGCVSTANNPVFNIALGAFATAFSTVLGFHFGSSAGSKQKDRAQAMQALDQTAGNRSSAP